MVTRSLIGAACQGRRRRAVLGALATLSVAVLVSALGTLPAAAAPSRPVEAPAAPSAPLAAPSPDLPGLAALSPELTAVRVDGAGFRRAADAYQVVSQTHAGAQGRRAGIDLAATELAAHEGELRAEVVAARARAAGLSARLDDVESAIADLGVSLYVAGGSSARVDAALAEDQPAINDHDRRAVLGTASMDVLLAERAAYRQRLDEAATRVAAATEELTQVTAAREEALAARADAVAEEVRAGDDVAEERVRYEEARALATVDGVDFSLVTLDAYVRAARSVSTDDFSCGVRWWAVAGISRVEGRHGTYGGSTVDVRGDTTRRIIGIQLNGTNETAVIADSDGGALDGDPAFDRAVGPMQFIPQTWARFASDGNGDGVATPFNMYDATLAAARYLCTSSRGLDADPGLRAAYLSYNHSEEYVSQVLAHARAYEQRIALPPIA